MAKFYGILQGNRGEVTRCGSKSSGVSATVASWKGAVSTRLWYNEKEKCDWVDVCLKPWHGSGVHKKIYSGPVGEYVE